jgi:hypothetical protein
MSAVPSRQNPVPCPYKLRCTHGLDCKMEHSVDDKMFFLAVDKAERKQKIQKNRNMVQCRHYENCTKSECTYYHSPAERAAIAAQIASNNKKKRKSALCRLYMSGTCKHNRPEDCNFAHGESDLCSNVIHALGEDPVHVPLNPKRAPCKFFAEGTCTRGDACNFAHGENNIHSTSGRRPAIRSQDGPYHDLSKGLTALSVE